MAKWKDQYTPDQVKHIEKVWVKPPAKCTGKCNIKHTVLTSVCAACRWSDDPVLDTIDANIN